MEQPKKAKLEIRLRYSEEIPLALFKVLSELGIPCRFVADNGTGALLITIGEEEDAELLRLWDWLSEIRVCYIEARQQAVAEQLSFLEGR